MSINKPNQYDIETAYRSGMGNFQGDAEVAEDLGIPVDSETLASHMESASEARQALMVAANLGRVSLTERAMSVEGAEDYLRVLQEEGPEEPRDIR